MRGSFSSSWNGRSSATAARGDCMSVYIELHPGIDARFSRTIARPDVGNPERLLNLVSSFASPAAEAEQR